MEQRRLLIALVISLLLIVTYQELVLSRYRKPQPAPQKTVPAETKAPPTQPPAPQPSGELAAPPGEGGLVSVETDLFRVVITPVGARLTDVELKGYRRSLTPDSAPLDLVQTSSVLPGTLQLGAAQSDASLAYRADRAELVLHGEESGEIVFVGDSPRGLHLEKRYRFTGESYLFQLTAALSGEGERPSTVGLVLTPPPPETSNSGEQAIALSGHRLIEKPLRDLLKQPLSIDPSSWAGFAAKYFLGVGMPENGTSPVVMTADGDLPIVQVEAPLVDGQAAFALYTGPKDRDVLARAGHDLERALDFGMFWFVAVPLLRALRLLHAVTGNYGIAIIVLTALVKVVTAPLTQTTFRNMREMQKIQPQMTKLRERFKEDQAALQKEMMELYRRHRVNPFSGCVPMLLQLPIFVGLYNALSHAIELRHAPFAFWINDLSAPDRLVIAGVPVPILTLLMGASMFLQQWLTPQQGDPTQQRMMMFMPLMFTYFMMNFPAGLVLYWLVNNILTIGQQYLMMRSMK